MSLTMNYVPRDEDRLKIEVGTYYYASSTCVRSH